MVEWDLPPDNDQQFTIQHGHRSTEWSWIIPLIAWCFSIHIYIYMSNHQGVAIHILRKGTTEHPPFSMATSWPSILSTLIISSWSHDFVYLQPAIWDISYIYFMYLPIKDMFRRFPLLDSGSSYSIQVYSIEPKTTVWANLNNSLTCIVRP